MKKHIFLLLLFSIFSFSQEKEIRTLSDGNETILLTLKNGNGYIITNKDIKVPHYATSPLINVVIEFEDEIVKDNYNFFKNIDEKTIKNIIVLSSVNSIVRRIKVAKTKNLVK